MFSKVIAVVVVTVLVFARNGQALKCYQCNSAVDNRCDLEKEKIPQDFYRDCPASPGVANRSYILCRKIKQSIDFEVNGLPPDTRIIRSCGFEEGNYKNKCYHKSGFGSRQEVCACYKDGCNHGNYILSSVITLLCSIVFARLLQ